MAIRKRNKSVVKPWYRDCSIVAEFEREAVKEYPSLTSKLRIIGKRKWHEYTLMIDLQEYECRKVRIRFTSDTKYPPKVTVDGPRESLHRYNGGALCMWYPKDPDDQKWIFQDGLLELLVMIEFHLYREALWRETGGFKGGEWYGPEAPH